MDRQAFKQRMQNLKSYRENNPGKGYWDWKDDRTDHPIKKPTLPQEPIRIQYAIRNLGGKPDESWRKYDKDNDGQLSSEERLNRQKDERRIEDWKNLGRGISNTFGTATSLAGLIGGGGWALTRLLAGNRATQLGRSLAPLVLPTNAADNIGDIIDFATEPTTSKAVEIGVGLGLGKWKDFGSTARQAAELGSQSLNATNTFTESFADGGQTGDPEKERFYQATGRSSSGRPLEEGLKPVFSLEDAANMTPIGDAISAKDAYNAVKNRDWLGAGLAASAMIPFIPNVYRSLKSKISREVPTVTRSFQRQVDANDLRRDLENNNRRRVLEEYSDQRNRAYKLLNTPEARRRAQIIDRKYGTEYNKVYDDLTKEYEDINSYVNLPEPNFVSNKKDYANIDPSKSKIINLSTDNIRTAEDYPKGLIRHEIGHYVDEKAYPGGVPNNAYLRQLGKPSKYRSFSEVEHMFPDKDRAKSVYEYLRKPTEKKSIMNQFDEYLMNTLTPSTYPTNTKQFRQVIESAPDLYNNMKMLLKIHTKPSVLYKDFLARPLVNKISKNKNQEIV